MLVMTLFCCTTACVNQIEKEIQEGNIPITFSIKEGKASTKATNNLFDKGDKIALYAMLPESGIDQKRYIDNLCLTCGSNNTLIPSKDIFIRREKMQLSILSATILILKMVLQPEVPSFQFLYNPTKTIKMPIRKAILF